MGRCFSLFIGKVHSGWKFETDDGQKGKMISASDKYDLLVRHRKGSKLLLRAFKPLEFNCFLIVANERYLVVFSCV